MGMMGSATNKLLAKFTKVYVPPHVRVVDGETVHVDGYSYDRNEVPKAAGDCYEVAGKLVFQLPGAKLVHGNPKGQGPLEGHRVKHAWVESGDQVFDFSNGQHIVMPKSRYYELAGLREDEVVRFTPEQALGLMEKNMHWGPWKPVPLDEDAI